MEWSKEVGLFNLLVAGLITRATYDAERKILLDQNLKGTGNNNSNQGYVTGEDWNNYFKEKYGASNVQWKPNSFQDIIDNPQRLWGCTASEIESILGDGWQFKTYGSNGLGWEFHSPQGRVFYHAGGGIHGGSYYGFGTGPTGVVKLVDGEYIYFPDEKSIIIPRD